MMSAQKQENNMKGDDNDEWLKVLVDHYSSSNATTASPPPSPMKSDSYKSNHHCHNKNSTFATKLFSILSNPKHSDIITWISHGKSWKIIKPKQFMDQVIPNYFDQMNKYSSFVRQVNGWGFKRIPFGPDRDSYYHVLFLRDKPELVAQMKRRKKRRSPSVAEDDAANYSSDDNGPTFYEIYGLPSSNITSNMLRETYIQSHDDAKSKTANQLPPQECNTSSSMVIPRVNCGNENYCPYREGREHDVLHQHSQLPFSPNYHDQSFSRHHVSLPHTNYKCENVPSSTDHYHRHPQLHYQASSSSHPYPYSSECHHHHHDPYRSASIYTSSSYPLNEQQQDYSTSSSIMNSSNHSFSSQCPQQHCPSDSSTTTSNFNYPPPQLHHYDHYQERRGSYPMMMQDTILREESNWSTSSNRSRRYDTDYYQHSDHAPGY